MINRMTLFCNSSSEDSRSEWGKVDFIPSHVHSPVRVRETQRRPLFQRSTVLNHLPLSSAGSVSVSPAVCPSSLLPDPSTLRTVYPPGPVSEWFFHYKREKENGLYQYFMTNALSDSPEILLCPSPLWVFTIHHKSAAIGQLVDGLSIVL